MLPSFPKIPFLYNFECVLILKGCPAFLANKKLWEPYRTDVKGL